MDTEPASPTNDLRLRERRKAQPQPGVWYKRACSRDRENAEEFGWRLVGVKGDHHNFKHPASRYIITIVHPQKDVPVGRAADTVKKITLEVK